MRIEFVGRRPLLRRGTPVHRTEDPGHLVLDMRQLTFASPLELAAVAALAQTFESLDVPTTLHMPGESDISSYLARMDLRAALPPGSRVVGSAPEHRRLDRSDKLVEVMRVSAETEDELMDRIGRVALAQLDPAFGRRAVQSIGELVDNAVSHGASPIGAFAAAQTYTGRTSKRRGLEFAICDTGIGILKHLRKNPAYRGLRDDKGALAHALQPGVTGTSDKRGNGLADLFNVTDNAGYSILVLRSGTGLASVAARRDDRRRDYAATADEITGTWAWLRVRDP
ncbi:hypothetical protein ONA91_08295 [Micromonospora sp. DR5-3]|uniref:hypothetical protein n=1 Tax=unclassified Micromonospora TaxID=2617518 RepID=UPI0011D34F01|nr:MULTISPECIES: hypothetical protein [unclassified Micromonospora]MCW3814457.1 hypothetical protein [Micromonospora sp. DR5-3]TYC22678.1 hypothetical protein FXF52_19375 [Micromonospora sp. MP36]